MSLSIAWTAQSKADIRAIDQSIALQILKTLSRYAHTGEGDTKQLQGIDPPLIRLRAQDYRILFRNIAGSIVILRILNRKQAYR